MDLHSELRSLIGLVRRRWTWLVTLRTTARASVVFALLLVVGAIVEYVFRLQGIPLLVLAAATGVLALAVAALAACLTPRHPSDRRVARFIEERAKALSGRELDDSLVSAIDAAERPADAGPAAFLPLMLGDAVRKLRAIQPAEILTHSELRRGALRAAAGAALVLVALVASAPLFERAAATARLRFFSGSIRVEVLPGNVRVLAGSSLRIRASLHGSNGVLTRFTPELTVLANGERRTVPMALMGDAFEFTIGSVDRTFSYVVSAGSAQSSRYTVTALTAPRVERIDLHYVYPSFAGLAPRDEQDGGDIYAPAGTRVRLRIHTDKPIARAELALGHSPAVSLQAAGARTVEAELLLARNDSYRVRLAGSDGLKSISVTWTRTEKKQPSASTFQVPATRPRYAHRPFLSVLRVGPPPRAGWTSLSVAPTTGVPSEATTRPSTRPLPFQSWACATLAPRTARLRMLPRTSLGKGIKADLLMRGL